MRLSPQTVQALSSLSPSAWCSREHHAELLRVLAAAAGPDMVARAVLVECGRLVASDAGAMFLGLAHRALTPGIFVRKLQAIWEMHHRAGRLEIELHEPERGVAVVRLGDVEGYDHVGLHCQGFLEFVLSQLGLAESRVELHGWAITAPAPDSLVFEITWAPPAVLPPEERELRESVVDALLVLAKLGFGDHVEHVPAVCDLPGPLGVLFDRVADFAAALGAEQEQSSAFRRELEDQLSTIERQRAAIRELSTPVIEVWAGVLCLPLVGVIDGERAAEVTETLLRAVVEKNARVVIIDITGINVMDTRTADEFLRMAQAVRLLGAECALAGLSPTIAQTIVELGVDLGALRTHRSLRAALHSYMARREAKRSPEPAAADVASPDAGSSDVESQV